MTPAELKKSRICIQRSKDSVSIIAKRIFGQKCVIKIGQTNLLFQNAETLAFTEFHMYSLAMAFALRHA
jgi:hypothetical protein